MLRIIMTIGCALALAGCSTEANYARDEYGGIEAQSIEVPGDDNYRLVDKPQQGKLMISPSLSGTASKKLQGALPEKPFYETMVRGYLDRGGRQSCRITDGQLIVQPFWEFKYDCSPSTIQPAPSRRR